MGILTLACHVTAFYYLWYGTPEHDGRYIHWNHSVLEHWSPGVRENFKHLHGYSHKPPKELHSPFYPSKGPYSVMDKATLEEQFKEMTRAGIDAVALSWWGRPDVSNSADSQGVNTNAAVKHFIQVADTQQGTDINVKVCFHMEPYPGRSVESFQKDVMYLHDTFGQNPSVQRLHGRMVFYVYDSYHIQPEQWRRLLKNGDLSLDKSKYPSYFIALWVDKTHGKDIVQSGFDAAYTYFAATGFSYASSPANWKLMASMLQKEGLAFIPSVGPGYNDTRIRPWNAVNTRSRENGAYYDRMWQAAVDAEATVVTVTSFNEWGEGTQIEPVEARLGYETYSPHPPDHYLAKTAEWKKTLCSMKSHAQQEREDEL